MRQRSGLLLIALGLLLAGATSVVVIRIASQAAAASRAQVRQVNVVTTTRNILANTPITADALVMKAFPADFAPPGALASPELAVGKIATGYIAKDQVLVADQVAVALPSPNLSDRVPAGKVAVWLPMPDLLASAQVLKPGDRVDILLSVKLNIPGEQNQSDTGGLSTQTTLQNVEVFRLGQEEVDLTAPGTASGYGRQVKMASPPQDPAAGSGQGAAGAESGAAAKPTAKGVIGFLVDHQDALIVKFVKDSGGTIDLVLRSTDDQQFVRTDALTMDSLVERFRFRLPQPVTR